MLALSLCMRRKRVAFQIRRGCLFITSFAKLIHLRHGRWEALHPFDGRMLASGGSKTDVVRATMEAVCN